MSRHWLLIVVVTVIAAAVSVAATAVTSSTQWEMSTLVRIGPAPLPKTFTDPAYIERILQTAQQIANSDSVVEAAWARAGFEPAAGEPDPNTVSAEVERETELLRLAVVDDDQAQAQATLDAMLSQMQSEITKVYGDSVAFTPIDRGEGNEVRPPFLARAITGGFLGLLLAIGIAALIDRRQAEDRSGD